MSNDDPDQFNLLRKIHKEPGTPQRELAKHLGFSLGKLNVLSKLKTLRRINQNSIIFTLSHQRVLQKKRN